LTRIYLDNAATSYPKAPGVGAAAQRFIEEIGSNVNRSGYLGSLAAEETVFATRDLLGELLNFPRSENVIFTLNVTYGLNFLLKGLLKPGDHCLVSSLEHNAIMRPLQQLEARGVQYSRIMCDREGRLAPRHLTDQLTPRTKAVVLTHASNVCGTIVPVEEIGQICAEKGLIFIIDAAQTAGVLPLDFEKTKADALAFTGHKGLLGPQGVGGFLIKQELAEQIEPLILGGTGSLSEQETQPPYLPDKFEAGTLNLPGIAGLHAALQYLKQMGIDAIREQELELAGLLLEGLGNMPDVQIIGLQETQGRTAVVSVNFTDRDNGEMAYLLDKHFGIQTRCGLHCSPAAHKTLGTFPSGTVRFSPGHFNTKKEIATAISAVHAILTGNF